MGFRVITISSRCKLESQLNYLVVRSEHNTRILFDEIETVIIANTQASLTCAVLSEFINHHIKVIFCDEKRNPQSELMGLNESYRSSETIASQVEWTQAQKDNLWQLIIKEKLKEQADVALKLSCPSTASALASYSDAVMPGDPDNREGTGAHLYFETIFGLGFNRNNDRDERNAFLNYGYSLLLSSINQEIVASGYLTQIGIHHRGKQNPFNLACDFMEPLRPLIDIKVLKGEVTQENFKKTFQSMMAEEEVTYQGRKMFLSNAIHLYVLSLLNALSGDALDKAKFISPLDYGH